MLSGTLDGHQQRKQAFAIPRAGIFLQGLAKRQMLGLGFGRKPRCVGRKKRERGLLVLAVLCKVEMNTPHQIPGMMTALEKLLHCELGFSQFGIEGQIRVSPQLGQHVRRQIFRASHWWDGRSHRVDLPVRGDRYGRLGSLGDTGKGTQCGHVARPEFPPIRQRGRQNRPHLAGTQEQQAVP